MIVKGLDHVYYWTRDMDRAVSFYRDVLGLALTRRDGDNWAEFEAGPARVSAATTDSEMTSTVFHWFLPLVVIRLWVVRSRFTSWPKRAAPTTRKFSR